MLYLKRTAQLAVLLVFIPAGRPAQAQSPKYYFEVRGVKITASGGHDRLKGQAQTTLAAELKKYPEVVTELGAPPPRGQELIKALEARHLVGYGLVLRLTKLKHELLPPSSGKVYKTLMVEVKVAIDAEKIPSGQMALAGEGSAQVGTEVSKFSEKEKNQLLIEALGVAIQQAVKQSVEKLGAPAEQPKKKKRRPRRKKK